MPVPVRKSELAEQRTIVERIRRALEREHAAETKAIESVRKRFEASADDNEDEEGYTEYDPKVVADFLHTWTPPREIDGELRGQAIYQLARLTKIIDGILATNTIRLYDLQIPHHGPGIGSLGDISQFEVVYDPVE